MVTGVNGAAGEAAARLVTAAKCDATGPVTTPDPPTVGEHVPALIHKYRDAAQPPALLMVIGVHGRCGENVPLRVEVEKEHVSDSATVRLRATVADCVQVTPPSSPGVTRKPVQVAPRELEEAS